MKNACTKWHVLETISIYKPLLKVKIPIPDRIFTTKCNKATHPVKWFTVPLNNYQYYVSIWSCKLELVPYYDIISYQWTSMLLFNIFLIFIGNRNMVANKYYFICINTMNSWVYLVMLGNISFFFVKDNGFAYYSHFILFPGSHFAMIKHCKYSGISCTQ